MEKKLTLRKFEEASEIVKENYDIDTKLEKYKRVKSKTDKISYELYFSKVATASSPTIASVTALNSPPRI